MLPEALTEDAKTEPPSAKNDDFKLSVFAVFAILLGLSIFFYKSVFLGKPLAKLGLLPALDAMFNPALTKPIISFADPSGYLIFYPNGHFADSMWSRFVLPLWNPLTACGYPLVGDPQSLIHSAAHFLRLFANPDAYNIGLLLEIALGGTGMLLLSRYHKFSVPASILSGLAFVLSPRILVQIDIAGNESFFPWIFLGLSWLSRRPTLLKAAVVGILCAAVAFATHPETVFFAVAFAALFALFMISGRNVKTSKDLVANCFCAFLDFLKGFGYLLVTAFVSLSIAAPLIFPFLQYMDNSHLYKESLSQVAVTNWSEFVAGYLVGLGNEALFIGAIAALLVPLGFCGNRLLACSLFLCLLIAFPLCIPDGLVLQLLSQRPFNFVASYYGTPEIVIFLALLAGMGLDVVLAQKNRCRATVLALSATAVIVIPVIHIYNSLAGIGGLGLIWKSGYNTLTFTSILAGVALLVLVLYYRINSIAPSHTMLLRNICATVLLLLNFGSLALAGRSVLPVNPRISDHVPEPIQFLQSTHSRTLSTGKNFFLPNVNMDYGIEDFRCFSPLLPKRFFNFLHACSAKPYNLYFYDLPNNCSRLLDLASVRFIATKSAIRSDNDDGSSDVLLPQAKVGRVLPGLRILSNRLSYDSANSQVNADLCWRVHQNCDYRYAVRYYVIDAQGNELWSSRDTVISPATEQEHTFTEKIAWPIAKSATKSVVVAMQITDTWISQVVKPDTSVDHVGNKFVLCRLSEELVSKPRSETGHKRFVLCKEFPEYACRIYENKNSLPGAYLCNKIRHFPSGRPESILSIIDSVAFQPQYEAIVEDQESDGSPICSKNGLPGEKIQAQTVSRPDCNTVEVRCNAKTDSYLILTDAYYPGWKCYIDGAETEIFPANYMFRAVKMPVGTHTARFVFAPASYYYSLVVSSAVFLAILLCALSRRRELFLDGRDE